MLVLSVVSIFMFVDPVPVDMCMEVEVTETIEMMSALAIDHGAPSGDFTGGVDSLELPSQSECDAEGGDRAGVGIDFDALSAPREPSRTWEFQGRFYQASDSFL